MNIPKKNLGEGTPKTVKEQMMRMYRAIPVYPEFLSTRDINRLAKLGDKNYQLPISSCAPICEDDYSRFAYTSRKAKEVWLETFKRKGNRINMICTGLFIGEEK